MSGIGLISLAILLLAQVTASSCNLSNSLRRGELDLLNKLVDYLRDTEIRDDHGHLLADKYLVGQLDDPRPHEETFKGATVKDVPVILTSANMLCHGRAGSYRSIWHALAADMLRAIDEKTLADEQAAREFRQHFINHILHPWLDVIQEWSFSILNLHNQDAAHQANFEAHQDSFVLVRQRLIEKLSGILPPANDSRTNAYHLPQLAQWLVVGRTLLDYIKFEFFALKDYQGLRDRYFSRLSESERKLTVEVLPKTIDGSFNNRLYSKFEVNEAEPADWLNDNGTGHEIDEDYLVAKDLKEQLIAQSSVANLAADERRRMIWRSIYKAVRILSVHALKENKTIDGQMLSMLRNFKDAVAQRANVLNGMLDRDITLNMLEDFHLHRDNLNGVFAHLAENLSDEQHLIYERLMEHLGITRIIGCDQQQGRDMFQLQVDHESLWTVARDKYFAALDQIEGVSKTVAAASGKLASVLEGMVIASDYDLALKLKLVQAVEGLRSTLIEIFKFYAWTDELVGSTDNKKLAEEVFMARYLEVDPEAAQNLQPRMREKDPRTVIPLIRDELETKKSSFQRALGNLRDFRTFMSAFITRTEYTHLNELVAILLEAFQGILL